MNRLLFRTVCCLSAVLIAEIVQASCLGDLLSRRQSNGSSGGTYTGSSGGTYTGSSGGTFTTITRTRSRNSYGSTGGVYTGSSGGTYTGSSGGTFVTRRPLQVLQRPRANRTNFVERSVVVSDTNDNFCPNCGRRLAAIFNSAKCQCCDKCTGQADCNCGCANCNCSAKKDDQQPLNPDRPPGYKSEVAAPGI